MDLTRRDFLKAGGALSTLVGQLAGCSDDKDPHHDEREVLLDVKFAELALAGRTVRVRTYGGAIPGPTISTAPGKTLTIRVKNQLPFYDSSTWNPALVNVPHHLNTTNLHVHGLEVVPHLFEPVGTKDPAARMIAIGPGTSKTYVFELPENHPTGLYWYHPHHHGSTSVQVLNGMAGLILVKGAIDEVPEIAAAKDYQVAVQDLGLFELSDEPGVWMYDPPQNAIWATFTGKSTFNDEDGNPIMDAPSGFSTGDYPLRLFLVNGSPVFEEIHNADMPTQPVGSQLEVPRFTLQPGEVARFRFLNGCSDNLIPLMVEQHDMHLIAVDGVNFTAPRLRPYVENASDSDAQVLLPSGGRAEFLIRAIDTPGVYAVKQIFQMQQFLESAEKVLFEIEIKGEAVAMDLPTVLPTPTRHYPLLDPDKVSVRRTVVFGMVFPPVVNKLVGLDFEMNGAAYDEETVGFQPKLGAIEEWTIDDEQMESAGHMGSMEGHPFHLHTNSFEVISINGVPVEPGTIQDTVWVPHMQKVVIRVKFEEWTGKDVFHCHILPHEDTGMMQNLLITA
jgi:FtsP/CotA-like multicopper oxidase with cupredoxin domain